MIDPRLVERINSERCFALVGSGPSSELRYPSWKELANLLLSDVAETNPDYDRRSYEAHLEKCEYPELFSQAEDDLGGRRQLVDRIRLHLRPQPTGGRSRLYDLLVRWPFACYLTTNWDNELHDRLARAGVRYRLVGNTVTAFQQIRDGTAGLVVKLHGDLNSPDDAVITSRDYHEFDSGSARKYFRDRLRQIVETFDLVVVGHSLYDPDLRLVLKVARETIDPAHPLYLFAADCTKSDEREYLERYNVHVVGYENPDGHHAQLYAVLKANDSFVNRREAGRSFVNTPTSAADESAAASALFLYRRLHFTPNDRLDPDHYLGPLIMYIVVTALPTDLAACLQSPAIQHLARQNPQVAKEFSSAFDHLQASGAIVFRDGHLAVSEEVAVRVAEVQSQRRRIAEGAYADFRSKLKEHAPLISEASLAEAVLHFESVLVDSYRKRGLSLASAIFARVSTKGDTLTELCRLLTARAAAMPTDGDRSAFTIASRQFLIDPTTVQKEYLEAVSQGFFLYHLLGCDPACAALRADIFKRTLWVIDSNVLLALLAQGCFQYDYAKDLYGCLRELHAQLFTTEKLAREAFEHLSWARANTPLNAAMNSAFLATALVKGSVTQNLFVDGFIQMSAESRVADFDDYLTVVLPGSFTFGNFLKHLVALGVGVLYDSDISTNVLAPPDERASLERKIRSEREARGIFKSDLQVEAEAEVVQLLGAVKAKAGRLADFPAEHAYFVSTSRVLDRVVEREGTSTWSAEAVYRYIKALPGSAPSAALLQQCMLQEFYHAGTAFIDRPRYIRFFGPQIEQAKLSFQQQKELYVAAIEKVSSPQELEDNFAHTPELEKPYFVSQMGWAAAEAAERSRAVAEEAAKREAQRAREAEGQVRTLMAQRDKGWRTREKRRQRQILATERNKLDPKHVKKRERQATKRHRKK